MNPMRWNVRRLLSIALTLASVMLIDASAPTGSPVELNAVIPLTGGAAFLGTQEKIALQVFERTVNGQGGIAGRPVKFNFLDDQSVPQTTLQLANGLVAKGVPVIFGSSVTATCNAIVPLLEKTGPVNYCFSPGVTGAPRSFVFSSSVGTRDIALALMRFFHDNGWTRFAALTSTDATGLEFDRWLDLALRAPGNKDMTLLAREHFNPTDITVTAQLSRIKATNPQAILTFTTGTPLGTVLRGYTESGMDIPITASAGNMIYAQMAQYKDVLPKKLYFAATRGVAPDALLRPGPIKDAQNVFFKAFKDAGIRSDFGATLVWDPAMIVVDGLRAVGPEASGEKLRDWMINQHSWAGIDGIYDFADGSQRGIGLNAMIIYHWNAATTTFDVSSRSGGALK
jgi:branched-chain amino acid transport system substrate-binding protein